MTVGVKSEFHQLEKIETKYRNIVTQIPVPESLSLFEQLNQYECFSMHGQLPVVWDRAEGFQVYDRWGNKWIDFTSTIFVANAGHGNEKIRSALKQVIDKPLLHTYTYASQERADYLKYLIDNTPAQFEKAFLLSAGTEATEAALKLMRLNAIRNKKNRGGVICFEGNWHGRTMGAQMMSSNKSQRAWIGYDDPNVYHLPFPYPWCEDAMKDPRGFFRTHMDSLIKKYNIDPANDLCGVMLETFQGWGAVFYPKAFVQEVCAFAKEHNILVAFDEMQAGFGRTGELFGYMHYDVEPDLLCCGKGASSSLPLSFVIGSSEVMDIAGVGDMSSTHSANPLACVAGHANLQALLEDGLIDNSKKLGRVFHDGLKHIQIKYPHVLKHIQGEGLLAACIFYDDNNQPMSNLCTKICYEALRSGLILVHTGRESIKMAPPLSICEEALREGLRVFETAIESVLNGRCY